MEAHNCRMKSALVKNVNGHVGLDRLFLIDQITIGLVQIASGSLSIYKVNGKNLTVELVYTKSFYFLNPFDACSLSPHDIFIVFPDSNIIRKYKIHNNNNIQLNS